MRRIFAPATAAAIFAAVAPLASSPPAHAQQAPAAAPAATDQQPASPPTSPLTVPGITGPLAYNPTPAKFGAGPLGDVYVSGVASALGQWQNSVFPGDRRFQADVSNGQVFVQKIDGLVQFFAQAGAYSLPDLGVPYIRAAKATNAFYGALPQAFLKLAPTDNFSIIAGKLPTLIGAEYTFSFENMNIQRGLLWNQENAVNRGVQANYTLGPLAFALSWNDGFYSNRYSWAWGSVTYTVDPANTVSFIGSGNTRHTNVATTATPLFQNNEQLYNIIYTHTSGPWTIEPYLQYTFVPKSPVIGTTQDAATYGAALFVNYAFDGSFGGINLAGVSLPVRLEYIGSTGSTTKGAPSLIYGPSSNAWSITVTPTYQYKVFFGRAEFSYVKANNITNGFGLGPTGTNDSETRVLLETGMLF